MEKNVIEKGYEVGSVESVVFYFLKNLMQLWQNVKKCMYMFALVSAELFSKLFYIFKIFHKIFFKDKMNADNF